ncbi:MAG: hypothetical protein AB1327_00790 [Bacillota bacterium]
MPARKVSAPGYGFMNDFWSPAVVKDGKIVFSALGGIIANPDYHVRTATAETVPTGPDGPAIRIGTSVADQVRIIFSHITDVLDAEGKTLYDVAGFTLVFRPGTATDVVQGAIHAVDSQMGQAPYTLTTLFCDFLGREEEVLQIIPHLW